MENLMDNVYSTKDLGECVALVTSGLALKSINWKDGVAYFVFPDPARCKELSQKYFFEELALPVRKYHENLNLVKGRLYSSTEFLNSRGRLIKIKGGGRNVQSSR